MMRLLLISLSNYTIAVATQDLIREKNFERLLKPTVHLHSKTIPIVLICGREAQISCRNCYWQFVGGDGVARSDTGSVKFL